MAPLWKKKKTKQNQTTHTSLPPLYNINNAPDSEVFVRKAREREREMAGRLFRKADRPSEAIQRAALLQGMHLYYVKYYGKEEVPDARGEKVVDYALHRILSDRMQRKREGIKSARVELSVSAKGIKVTDRFVFNATAARLWYTCMD